MSKKTMKKAKASKTPTSNWGLYIGIGIVVLVLVVIAAIFFLSPPNGTGPAYPFAELTRDGHFKGNPAAKVTVVEFSDFQCPACGAAFAPVKSLIESYGDRVQFVYRHFPLTTTHPFAVSAAEASECASDQNKFWEMHDALFTRQSEWTPLGKDGIRNVASDIGLDGTAYDACVQGRTHRSIVQRGLDDGVRFGVNATPTFFVDGVRLEGGFNQSALQSAIDAALAK
ncbi:MAG: thioredoxin domain-containing protein [Candidatus Diapherotrites archaeon]|nr:thioredoxin domain-containing protein [Candidatus Diapherotrites archaeon]